MSMPPLTSAASATAVCSGVTARPWPKATVIAVSSDHFAGTIGLRDFRQLGLEPREQAEAAEIVLLALGADLQRHARRADVGGIDEHLRHGQHAVLAVEVVDGEAADADGAGRVDLVGHA